MQLKLVLWYYLQYIDHKTCQNILTQALPPVVAALATSSPIPNWDIKGPSCPEWRAEPNTPRACWNWGEVRTSCGDSCEGGRWGVRRSCASVLLARGRRTSAVTTSGRPTASSWEAGGSEGMDDKDVCYQVSIPVLTFFVLLYWEVHGREDVLKVSQL